MPYYTLNKRRVWRYPDRMYRIQNKSCLFVVYLTFAIDALAGFAVHFNAPQVLDLSQRLLSPISWLFDLIRLPITGSYFDGSYPLYYRVLLLSSALAGIGMNVILTGFFVRRFRFFRRPAYRALAYQRDFMRHRDFFKRGYWYYYFFNRIMSIVIIVLSLVTFYFMYLGHFTFHAHDTLVMPIIFSLLPGLFWGCLSICIVSLISCFCSDLLAIRKALIR